MPLKLKFSTILLILTSVLFSCKKSITGRNDFSSLDLTNASGLVIPQDSAFKDTAASNVLFKLTGQDALESVFFESASGSNMTGYYLPESFYTINNQYFLATFSVIGSSPKKIDSYIIKYSDGKGIKLPAGYYPMRYINNRWQQDPSEKCILTGPNNNYYFRGEDRIYNITQTALDLFDNQIIGIYGTASDIFCVDSEGNIMIGNTIYSSPVVSYASKVFSSSGSFVSASYANGFSILNIKNQQIEVYHSYVQNHKLTEDTVSVLPIDGTGWKFIGCYKFSTPAQLIYVFNQGLIRVDASGASQITFSDLSLSQIELAGQSDSHLYLATLNGANQQVFLQLSIANDPVTYSQIFAPDQYQITHLNVFNNDDLMFQGIDLGTQTNVFGYYSNAAVKVVVNYQNINSCQLITIK